MKKTLLALALAVATMGTASAHRLQSTHYHTDEGRVVMGNTIAPEVEVTYETDRWGRRIKVTETTTCVETRVNRRNRHLRCLEEETEVTRVVDRPAHQPAPTMEPRIQRFIERDNYGRHVLITVTDTCTRPSWQDGRQVCYRWERDIDREYVQWDRMDRDRGNFDFNGDGRTDGWERLLYQSFRDVLENNR